jgi:7-cyano-7-deazaguanine reductase
MPRARQPRSSKSAARVETFPNPAPQREYLIRHVQPEFTSVCPKTGQPDFGRVVIEYVPGAVCVELKSLKQYLQAFRNEGIFYEAVTNRILDELVTCLRPRRMRVLTRWTPRGGMHSIVVAEYPSAADVP